MKAKKLLKNLAGFLSADEKAQREEAKAIKKLLRALKEKEVRLKKKLHVTSDPDAAAALQAQVRVIHAQRIKGVERLKFFKAPGES